jgi:predicted enzyme related to lactoylglutathione lyase
MKVMKVALGRIILFVQDVDRLASFYREAFGLIAREEIAGEWVVFDAGPCQLALHRVGPEYRVANPVTAESCSNAKLVLSVDRPLADVRAELAAKGARMGEIKSFPGLPGPLCDGRDPEGNVFQLVEAPGIC